MTDAQYEAKFQEMQKHIPFIQKVIEKLKVNNDQQGDNPRKAQLQKMEMLHQLLTNRAKKLKMETLMKCEGVLIKLQAKIEKHSSFLQNDDPASKLSGTKTTTTATAAASFAVTSSSTCSSVEQLTKSNNKDIASAPASPSPERTIGDDDDEIVQPVVIPTERCDSPVPAEMKSMRHCSIREKTKGQQFSRNSDHMQQRSQRSPPHHHHHNHSQQSSYRQFKDSPKIEELRRFKDGHRDRSPNSDKYKSHGHSSGPYVQRNSRHSPSITHPHSSSSKEVPPSSSSSPQTLQTVKVLITEPLPSNVAKQHFPPHHQYRYQHSPQSRDHQNLSHSLPLPPQGPQRNASTDEAYNPDESWEKYNEAQKNVKNNSMTNNVFSRLGHKVTEEEAIVMGGALPPKPLRPTVPEVLKSPPLTASDISNLLKESGGGDQSIVDISEIGTRRPKKPEPEISNSLDFVRRKFAQIAKINSPQPGEIQFQQQQQHNEFKMGDEVTPTERLALKYNPHPRQERLQSVSSNEGSECGRVGYSPNDPRLKLKASATSASVAGSGIITDPRLKKINNDPPQKSLTSAPIPNAVGGRIDPRLAARQPQLITPSMPRRMSTSQSYTDIPSVSKLSEENWDLRQEIQNQHVIPNALGSGRSDPRLNRHSHGEISKYSTPGLSQLKQQPSIPARRMSITNSGPNAQPRQSSRVSPQETWNSDNDFESRKQGVYHPPPIQRQSSGSMERSEILKPQRRQSISQSRDLSTGSLRDNKCTTVPNKDLSLGGSHPSKSYPKNPFVNPSSAHIQLPAFTPINSMVGPQDSARFSGDIDRKNFVHGPRTYKEHKEAREEMRRRAALESQKQQKGNIGEGSKKFLDEIEKKQLKEEENKKNKNQEHTGEDKKKNISKELGKKGECVLSSQKEKGNETTQDLSKAAKVVAADTTLDKMYRSQNFNAQFPKATLSFKIPKKKVEEPKIPINDNVIDDKPKKTEIPEMKSSKNFNKNQIKPNKNESLKKQTFQKSAKKPMQLKTKTDTSKHDENENEDSKKQEEVNHKPLELRDPRCKKKENEESSTKDNNENTLSKMEKAKENDKESSKNDESENTSEDLNSKQNNQKGDSKTERNDKEYDSKQLETDGSIIKPLRISESPNSVAFKPQRIMRRRCTMLAIGSAPLVDKDKLMQANALMLEDVQERDKIRRKKEEEERQIARRNKNLSEMFQKTDDNCSVSTQNIITGKRSTRATINFNETQNAQKVFKHLTVKDAGATSKRLRSLKANKSLSASKESINSKGDATDAEETKNEDEEKSEVTELDNEDEKALVTLMDSKEMKDLEKDKTKEDIKKTLNKKKPKTLANKVSKATIPVNKKGKRKIPIVIIKRNNKKFKKIEPNCNVSPKENVPEDEDDIPSTSNSSRAAKEPQISQEKEEEHQNCAVSSTSMETSSTNEEVCVPLKSAAILKRETDDNEPSSTGNKSNNPTPTPADDEASRHVFLNEFVQEITKPNADKQHILSLLSQILNEDKLQFIKSVIDSTSTSASLAPKEDEEEISVDAKEEVCEGSKTKSQKDVHGSEDKDPSVKNGEDTDEDDDEVKRIQSMDNSNNSDDITEERNSKKLSSKSGRRTPGSRKKRNELDRLNEDIRDMFICEGVLTATGKRMCTLMQSNEKKDEGKDSTGNKSSPEVLNETNPTIKRRSGRPKKSMANPRLRRSLRACETPGENANDDNDDDDEVEVITYKETEDSKNIEETPSKKKMPILKPNTPIKLPEEEIEIITTESNNDKKRKSLSTSKPCPKSKKSKMLKAKRQTESGLECDDSPSQSEDSSDNEIMMDKKPSRNSENLDMIKNTNIHWHNQSKYTTWCMMCNKKIFSMSSASHYKLHHGENYISRLVPSLLQKFKQGKLGQPMFGVKRKSGRVSWFFRCPFCLQYFNTPMSLWLEHFQNHTVEFRYECSNCHWGSSRLASTKRHINVTCKNAKLINSVVKFEKPSELKAHVCHLCNFVQLKRFNLDRHYREQHEVDEKNVETLGYTITLFNYEGVEVVTEDKAQTKEEEIRKQIELQEKIIELEDDVEVEGGNTMERNVKDNIKNNDNMEEIFIENPATNERINKEDPKPNMELHKTSSENIKNETVLHKGINNANKIMLTENQLTNNSPPQTPETPVVVMPKTFSKNLGAEVVEEDIKHQRSLISSIACDETPAKIGANENSKGMEKKDSEKPKKSNDQLASQREDYRTVEEETQNIDKTSSDIVTEENNKKPSTCKEGETSKAIEENIDQGRVEKSIVAPLEIAEIAEKEDRIQIPFEKDHNDQNKETEALEKRLEKTPVTVVEVVQPKSSLNLTENPFETAKEKENQNKSKDVVKNQNGTEKISEKEISIMNSVNNKESLSQSEKEKPNQMEKEKESENESSKGSEKNKELSSKSNTLNQKSMESLGNKKENSSEYSKSLKSQSDSATVKANLPETEKDKEQPIDFVNSQIVIQEASKDTISISLSEEKSKTSPEDKIIPSESETSTKQIIQMTKNISPKEKAKVEKAKELSKDSNTVVNKNQSKANFKSNKSLLSSPKVSERVQKTKKTPTTPETIKNLKKTSQEELIIQKNSKKNVSSLLSPSKTLNLRSQEEILPYFNSNLVTATYSKKKATTTTSSLDTTIDDCVIVSEDLSYKYLQDELLTLAAKAASQEQEEEIENQSKTPESFEIFNENFCARISPCERDIADLDPLATSQDNEDGNLQTITKVSDIISGSIDNYYQRNKRKSTLEANEEKEKEPNKEVTNLIASKKLCIDKTLGKGNLDPQTSNAFISTHSLDVSDSPPIQILAQSIVQIDPIESNVEEPREIHKSQSISIAERLSQRFKILQDNAKNFKENQAVKEQQQNLQITKEEDSKSQILVEKIESKKPQTLSDDVVQVISDDEDWEDIEITESAPNPIPSSSLQKSKAKGIFQKFNLFKGNSIKAKKNMPPLVFMPKKKAKEKQTNSSSCSSPITVLKTAPATIGLSNNACTDPLPGHLGFKPVINNIEDLLPDSPCNDPIDLVPELTPLEPLTDLNDISSILDSNLSINSQGEESHTCIQDALDFINEQQLNEQKKTVEDQPQPQIQTKFHKNKIQHVGYSLSSTQDDPTNVKFYCLLENCSFLFSSDSMGLENHFLCEHSQIKWTGFCWKCQMHCYEDKEERHSIVKEIKHMMDCHINGPLIADGNSNDSSQQSNLATASNPSAEERPPRIKLRRMTGDCLSTSNSECSTPSGTGNQTSVPINQPSSLLGALLNAKQKPPTIEMPPQPEMPLTEPLLMDNMDGQASSSGTVITNLSNDFQITSVSSPCGLGDSLLISNVVSLNKTALDSNKTSTIAKPKNIGNIWSQQIIQEKKDLMESAAASMEVSTLLQKSRRPTSREDSPGPVVVAETVPVAQEKRGDFVITQTVSAQYDNNASAAVGFNINIEVPPLAALNQNIDNNTLSGNFLNSNYSLDDNDCPDTLIICENPPNDSMDINIPHITSRQYKCMSQGCKFTSRVPVAMSDHLRFHERRNFSNNRDYFDCAFCQFRASDVEDYMKHSDQYHIIAKSQKVNEGMTLTNIASSSSASGIRGNICDILSKKMETTAQRSLSPATRDSQKNTISKQKETEQEYLMKLKATIEEIVGNTGLSDDKLYRCVIKNCPTKLTETTFHNHILYHISTLGIPNPNNYVFKCPHCSAQYHRPAGIKAHIKSHARNRYFCYMCDVTSANPGQMMKHFSEKHWHTLNMYTKELLKPNVYLSEDGSEKIYDSGYFVTYSSELCDLEVRKYGEKLILEWQRKKSGSKTHFKSSEIDLLPIQPIFQREVNCGECNYRTKVRTNMHRHLSMHKQYNQQPNTIQQLSLMASVDPVNPVPCLNSNERFFDKMTNLASSSLIPSTATNSSASSKTPFKLPFEFIPEENRFKCGVPNCNYLTVSDDMFRSHLSLIHNGSLVFRCPFCNEEICKRGVSYDRVMCHLRFHSSILYRCEECNYFHHLRFVVERHVNDKHPTMKVNLIRHERSTEVGGEGIMTPSSFAGKKYKEPLEKNGSQASSTSSNFSPITNTRLSSSATISNASPLETLGKSLNSSNSQSSSISGKSQKAKWQCDLCDHTTTSLYLVQTHCQNVHGQSKQYQCIHCNFGSQQLSQILFHIDEKHSGKNREARYIYHKTVNSSDPSDVGDTRPLWQRNDPKRVRHIRGILMEDEEESEKYRKKMGLDKVLDDDDDVEEQGGEENIAVEAGVKGDEYNKNFKDFLKGYEFGCFHCDFKTQNFEELSTVHYKKTHLESLESSKPFMFRLLRRVCCPECRKFTGTFYELQLHLLNAHNIRNYYAADLVMAESEDTSERLKCGYCSFHCLRSDQLQKHFLSPKVQHSPQDVCIENDMQLDNILQMGKKEQFFRCTLCSELMPNRVAVIHHATNMHDNEEEEGFSFRELSNSLIFHCALCSYTAATELELLRHMIDHYGRFKRCHFCHQSQISFENYMQHCYAEHREAIRKFRDIYQYKEIEKFLMQIFILFPNGLVISKRNLRHSLKFGLEDVMLKFYEEMYRISQQPPIPRLSIARLVARKSIESYQKQISLESPQNSDTNQSESEKSVGTAKKISKRRCTEAIEGRGGGGQDTDLPSCSKILKSTNSTNKKSRLSSSSAMDFDSSSNQSSEFSIPSVKSIKSYNKKRRRSLDESVKNKRIKGTSSTASCSSANEDGTIYPSDEEYYSFYGQKPERLDLSKIYTKVAIGGINTPLSIDKFQHLFNIDCQLILKKCDEDEVRKSNLPTYNQYRQVRKACPASHKLKYLGTE